MTSIRFDPVAFVLMQRLRTQVERERIARRARHVHLDRSARASGRLIARSGHDSLVAWEHERGHRDGTGELDRCVRGRGRVPSYR